jgi:DNA-binding IclR family transcriptional regulator
MPNMTQPSALASRPSSVEKAIDILFCFDAQHPQLRLTDISQRLGLHKSTTHRLLSLLKKKRLIIADAASQLYSLGPGVVELAWLLLRQQDLRTVSAPYLERLRQATNETVSLYVRIGDCRVCIEELESSQEIKYSQTLGLATPLHVGAPGKVLLAFLPPEELEVILATLPLIPLTARTITDRAHLLKELAIVRQRGYAVSEGERSPWTSAVAAPIWDWSGKLIATLSVLGPSQRLTSEILPGLSQQVQQVALDLSAALGYRAQSPTASLRLTRDSPVDHPQS